MSLQGSKGEGKVAFLGAVIGNGGAGKTEWYQEGRKKVALSGSEVSAVTRDLRGRTSVKRWAEKENEEAERVE